MRFSPGALRALLRYGWPGNVRELESALEFVVAVCQGQVIQERDLPPEIAGLSPAPADEQDVPVEHSSRGEKEHILEALDAHRWRRDETAQALGMSRTTLWRKMRELGLID